MFFFFFITTVSFIFFFFFFNDTATTEIYTLSLHDALPISPEKSGVCARLSGLREACQSEPAGNRLRPRLRLRSEEHTSELQSRSDLVCRLLLEKKKKKKKQHHVRQNNHVCSHKHIYSAYDI